MSQYRIAVLMHEDLIPLEKIPKTFDWGTCPWITEYDVVTTLKKMGHTVEVLGVHDELRPIRDKIAEFKPHVTFNLLEEFDNKTFYDQNVVSYLELLRAPYTGCNPRGLMLARDKAMAKKILAYHKIKTPRFFVFPRNRRKRLPQSMKFPLIVKCLNEEASLGIAKASVVHSEEKLKERLDYIHDQLGKDAIAEGFIEGQEIYVGVIGNYRLQALPAWGLYFDNVDDPGKEFYTNKAKFNYDYRESKGIRSGKANLPENLEKAIQVVAKKAYRALSLNGYARMDFRVNGENQIFLLEANPNPDIAELDEFSDSAQHAGYTYQDLLAKVLTLGMSWASRNAKD